MKFQRKLLVSLLAAGLSLGSVAQQGKLSDDTLKIGVLTDMSGVYADFGGTRCCVGGQNGGGRLWRQSVRENH